VHRTTGGLVLSPTDLVGYLACEHLLELELLASKGLLARPESLDPELDVLSRRGIEHEGEVLEQLRDESDFVTIPQPEPEISSIRRAYHQTLTAMREGARLIYQGTLYDAEWRGHPDFMLRGERPSSLGDYSYEIGDAKLARRVKGLALLQ
jgi:predicted RecB family nuclease